MINECLSALYQSKLNDLGQMYDLLDKEQVLDYVGPLLLYCWEEEYLHSKHRLMIVGQETDGWEGEYMRTGQDVARYVDKYRNFRLDEGYNSLFWQYAHEFNGLLNGGGGLNFVWNNVNKFGLDGIGKPDSRVLDCEVKYYNLLSLELDILKPDVCLFLSGPNYDGDLARKIPDVKFLNYKGYALNEASRLQSSVLPANSYRVYHPGYGNRYADWYMEMLRTIVADCQAN